MKYQSICDLCEKTDACSELHKKCVVGCPMFATAAKPEALPMPRPVCGTCDQWVCIPDSYWDGGDWVTPCFVCGGRAVNSKSDACLHHQDFPVWRASRRKEG